jgi:hypothetical protein
VLVIDEQQRAFAGSGLCGIVDRHPSTGRPSISSTGSTMMVTNGLAFPLRWTVTKSTASSAARTRHFDCRDIPHRASSTWKGGRSFRCASSR